MWRHALICVLILSISAAPAVAADWTWPERMKIGGVTVANIRGSVNADGSGTATGKVQAVDVGVRLVRSARGEISGSGAASFGMGGAEIQGMGVVGSGGFRVTGSVQGSVKTITDAAMSVNDEGRIQGSGRVFLGGLAALSASIYPVPDSPIVVQFPSRRSPIRPLPYTTSKEASIWTVVSEGLVSLLRALW